MSALWYHKPDTECERGGVVDSRAFCGVFAYFAFYALDTFHLTRFKID